MNRDRNWTFKPFLIPSQSSEKSGNSSLDTFLPSLISGLYTLQGLRTKVVIFPKFSPVPVVTLAVSSLRSKEGCFSHVISCIFFPCVADSHTLKASQPHIPSKVTSRLKVTQYKLLATSMPGLFNVNTLIDSILECEVQTHHHTE